MKNFLIPTHFCLFLLLNPITFAHAAELKFDTVPVEAKHPQYFSGTLPQLQGQGFAALNKKIQSEIYKENDQANAKIEIQTRKIYQDAHYLSFEVLKEISGGTMSYKNIYYTIDIKQKKQLNINDFLKQQQIPKDQIKQQLLNEIRPCFNDNAPEYCEFEEMKSLIANTRNNTSSLDLSQVSSFYLKKGILGLSFESTKYAYTFEYSIKIKTP